MLILAYTVRICQLANQHNDNNKITVANTWSGKFHDCILAQITPDNVISLQDISQEIGSVGLECLGQVSTTKKQTADCLR